MIIFKCALFIIACFTLSYSLFTLTAKISRSICSAIVNRHAQETATFEQFAIPLSFTYIMTYLFVW